MSLTLAFCLLLAALPIMNTTADSPVDVTALEYAQDWVDSNATDYGQQSFNLSEIFNVSAGGLGWSDDDFVCHNGNTTSASSVNDGNVLILICNDIRGSSRLGICAGIYLNNIAIA